MLSTIASGVLLSSFFIGGSLYAAQSAKAQQSDVVPQDHLPDSKALWKQIAASEQKVSLQQRRFLCNETVSTTHFSVKSAGRITDLSKFETFFVNGTQISRLLSRNGQALSAEDKQAEEQRVESAIEQAKHGPLPVSGDMSLTMGARILRNAKFTGEHRAIQDGRRFIVFDIKPHRRDSPETSMDALSQNVTGELWIDEQDKVIVRLIAKTASLTEFSGSLIAPKDFAVGCYVARRLGEGVYVPERWCGSRVPAPPLSDAQASNRWNMTIVRTEETLDSCRQYRATSRIEGLVEKDEEHKP